MSRLLKYTVVILICFAGLKTYAQDIKVNAVLDSSKIRIGEQVKLDLYLQYNPNVKSFKIKWPSVGDTITGKVEVIAVSEIDTTMPDKSNPSLIQQHQQLLISAYDSGYFAIPPFKFIVDNDTLNPLITEALLLEVHTVPTDTSLVKTKDIKEPFAEPFNWMWYKNYLYWGIAALVFVVGLTLLIYYYNKI